MTLFYPPAVNPSGGGTSFVIYYSSIDEEGEFAGKMWCIDCRSVAPILEEHFNAPDAPDAYIHYVGSRAEWKSPRSSYRHWPYSLSSVPTIVKLCDGKEVGRLEDSAISKPAALKEFIESPGDHGQPSTAPPPAMADAEPLNQHPEFTHAPVFKMLGEEDAKTCRGDACEMIETRHATDSFKAGPEEHR